MPELAVTSFRSARCGVGRCVYVDADVYEGEWRADMRHGWGRLRWADGGMYQGSWVKVQ